MWAATVEVEAPARLGMGAGETVVAASRYALVLAVWAGLALVRPKLAWSIFRERRPDSPLRRRTRTHG
ncbi:hypothetical protein [Phenylobacterium sp.]|uniref:hypothetical protein n=1 Tax=Phenylobacterium sp. TaxID=1871053 RepID=UPI0027372031|nr:hypothetical protein [Phenylobacterium sp.]MDP3658630.1 hypothetical protein [Phenylobacterium sp.]